MFRDRSSDEEPRLESVVLLAIRGVDIARGLVVKRPWGSPTDPFAGYFAEYVVPIGATLPERFHPRVRHVVFPPDFQFLRIEEKAFSETDIEVIAIPESVETIGNDAFYGCKSLRVVTFGPNSRLLRIGDDGTLFSIFLRANRY
jgi:hypothetical protein